MTQPKDDIDELIHAAGDALDQMEQCLKMLDGDAEFRAAFKRLEDARSAIAKGRGAT
jgi:hypothetical protein